MNLAPVCSSWLVANVSISYSILVSVERSTDPPSIPHKEFGKRPGISICRSVHSSMSHPFSIIIHNNDNSLAEYTGGSIIDEFACCIVKVVEEKLFFFLNAAMTSSGIAVEKCSFHHTV